LATTLVDISNSALIKVGAGRITSFDDDTKEAALCKEQLPKLRDAVLADHPWNFAVRRAELANLVETPAYEFDFFSQLPLDYLRVFEVSDGGTNTLTFSAQATNFPYMVEGKKLLHNLNPVFIRYIFRETVVANWNPMFAEALALRLAADIAYSLVQSRALQKDMLDAYLKFIATARSLDAQEGSVRHVGAGTWIGARN